MAQFNAKLNMNVFLLFASLMMFLNKSQNYNYDRAAAICVYFPKDISKGDQKTFVKANSIVIH